MQMRSLTPGEALEIEVRFNYHSPTGTQNERYGDIRSAMAYAARVVMQSSMPSREQSLALTKLEEAMFWANAGIARNE
jgi:hypothetical protein